MPASERILITVRTYPSPSDSFRETVCTGGINDQGEWRRLHPVPLRYLAPDQQYRTWDVISLSLGMHRRDHRPETRRPVLPTLRVLDHLAPGDARHQWVAPTILSSMRQLNEHGRSLAPVRVEKVLDLTAERDSEQWDPRRLRRLKQYGLFDEPKELEKVPYRFRFVWRDQDGCEHNHSVISWEMLQTWRSYRRRYTDAVGMMKDKLLGEYFRGNQETAFFMGNQWRFPRVFMICGWYLPRLGEDEGGFLF